VEPTITSLVRMGLTHAEIAERLGVSERHVPHVGARRWPVG
jgi:DNA-binding NarL/FixJ family response regulator